MDLTNNSYMTDLYYCMVVFFIIILNMERDSKFESEIKSSKILSQ